MNKSFLSIAALLGALSVALGAFGAHSLKNMTGPDTIAIFETGVRYQFYHVFALLIVALLLDKYRSPWLVRAGNCFLIGILLFSGSLYTLTALRISGNAVPMFVGIATPIGGVFFIAGWLLLWLGVTRKA